MANSLTLNAYADYVEIETDGLTNGYKLRKSFTSDVAYADTIYTEAGVGTLTWDDRSLLMGHTYYYWITQADGSTIVTGPTATRLVQRKLFGRGGGLKGSKRNKTWDYDVECPLCGKHCRRNTLRRGYVRPHQTGENYLPNGAAPENWVYSQAQPDYYDANTWNWFVNGETSPAFVFPCIEKDSDWRIPPGQNRYPGVPYEGTLSLLPPLLITIGTPSAAGTGYLIVWVYPTALPENIESAALQNAVVFTSSETLGGPDRVDGLHKIIIDATWNKTHDVVVYLRGSGNTLPSLVFGGAQLVTKNPEMAYLPHRSSGVGAYTTGGMMDLCSECYSGLRKRVPWG